MSANPDSTATDFLAHAPVNLFRSEVANLQRVLTEDEAEAALRRQEAMAKAQAAAQQEYQDSLHAKTEAHREDEPPSTDALGIDVAGLSRARAMLVRFAAWSTSTRADLAKLERAHSDYLDQIGAPAVSQRMLDEIEAQDRTGFLSWLRSGADRATHPTVDEFRRKAAQDKLADDSYSAQIEPRRVCRRLFSLSHATMARSSA